MPRKRGSIEGKEYTGAEGEGGPCRGIEGKGGWLLEGGQV